VVAVTAAASPVIARFFDLDDVVPVLLLAIWFAPAISSSLYDGVLIGTLRWRAIGLSLIAGAVVRVGAALLVGLIDPGVDGPILATVLNAIVTLGVVVYAIRPDLAVPDRHELRLPVRSVLPTVAALTGYSVLVAVDTLLARHTLAAGQSGDYAAAVTVGRVALFLPMAVTTVAFPRLVAGVDRGESTLRLLTVSLAVVLALGLAAAGVLAAAAHIMVAILFGHRYDGAVSLVPMLSLEGAILGAVALMTYFHLARRSILAAMPAATTIVVAAFVLLVGPSPHSLAATMTLACSGCLCAMGIGAYAQGRGRFAGSARRTPPRVRP
jgi:O-antigen/teichoic acid export membrane protein